MTTIYEFGERKVCTYSEPINKKKWKKKKKEVRMSHHIPRIMPWTPLQ